MCEKQKKIEHTLYVAICGSFLLLIIMNILFSSHMLDSDYATQLVLSKICAEENKIVTTSWLYGTELRLFNTQIIYGLMFKFFKNWHAVRTMGNIMLYILLLMSYIFMMKTLGFQKKWMLLTCVWLLLPYSLVDLSIVYMSGDYAPAIIFGFLFMGCFLRFEIWNDDKMVEKNGIVKFQIFACVLSLIGGMTGLRYVLTFFAPFVMTYAYRLCISNRRFANRNEFMYIGSIIAGFVLGYLINIKVFAEKYGYCMYSELTFVQIGEGQFLKSLEETFGAIIGALGYASNPVISLLGIVNIAIIVYIGVIFLLYMRNTHAKSEINEQISFIEKQDFLLQYFVCAVIVNICIFSFSTNRMIVPRYFTPVLVWMIPALGILLSRESDDIKKVLYTAIVCGFFLLTSMRTYYSMVRNDYNIDRYPVVDYLLEKELLFGYASPPNAGILTELSDGRIEMVGLFDIETGEPQLEICPKKYFYQDYQFDNPFLLISINEYNDLKHTDVIQNGNIIYQDNNYTILQYDNKIQICDYVINEK